MVWRNWEGLQIVSLYISEVPMIPLNMYFWFKLYFNFRFFQNGVRPCVLQPWFVSGAGISAEHFFSCGFLIWRIFILFYNIAPCGARQIRRTPSEQTTDGFLSKNCPSLRTSEHPKGTSLRNTPPSKGSRTPARATSSRNGALGRSSTLEQFPLWKILLLRATERRSSPGHRPFWKKNICKRKFKLKNKSQADVYKTQIYPIKPSAALLNLMRPYL
jgi:hypothetical protein